MHKEESSAITTRREEYRIKDKSVILGHSIYMIEDKNGLTNLLY